MNLTLISAAVAAAVGFGAAWQIQAGRMDSFKLEAANERINQQRVARATSERYSAALAQAQNAAQARRTVIAAAVACVVVGVGVGHMIPTVSNLHVSQSKYSDIETKSYNISGA